MDETRKALRRQLLAAETFTPALRAKYEKEMAAMLTTKLTGWKKAGWFFSMLMGLGFIALFGTVAVMVPAEFPLLGRIGFILGAVFGLAWVVLSVKVLRKGEFDIRKVGWNVAGLVWGFTVLLITLFLLLAWQAPERAFGTQLVTFGTVFLIMAATFLVVARVERAELNTREKLLEIEYRLAELAEQLGKGQPSK